MKKGILIYAHNSESVDYALMAIVAGSLAKKYLNVPASLVTDVSTVEWMKTSNILEHATSVFENLIIVNRPEINNVRTLSDGANSENIPFINTNRSSAWDLTPYDRTLLIDSDFLIFSDRLAQYWDVAEDVMIGESINDIFVGDRLGYHDRYISDVGVKLYWATTVMFTKNDASKTFFDTVNFIKENYEYYADVFRFDNRQFRNDIAFSIAKHILNGFEEFTGTNLPPVNSILDKDILHDVNSEKLILLISPMLDSNYCAASINGIDIHIMNKQSIIRNKDKLLGII